MPFGIILTMPSMTTCKPGEVVLVPFPFTDLSTTKQRPAVILSRARFNRERHDVILAAITSYTGGRVSWDEYRLDSTEQLSIVGITKMC